MPTGNQDTLLLTKRLDAIINVLLETATMPEGKKISVKEKIRILSDAKLRPIEISRILGISVNQVNVNLHALRAKKSKKTKSKNQKR